MPDLETKQILSGKSNKESIKHTLVHIVNLLFLLLLHHITQVLAVFRVGRCLMPNVITWSTGVSWLYVQCKWTLQAAGQFCDLMANLFRWNTILKWKVNHDIFIIRARNEKRCWLGPTAQTEYQHYHPTWCPTVTLCVNSNYNYSDAMNL